MTLYTDIDSFCCEVLAARVADGGLPPGDVFRSDIAALVGGRLRDRLRQYRHVHLFAGIGASPLGLRWAGWPPEWSIVTGGFPCQDISAAGKGAGLDGARSGMFWEMMRAIRILKPDGVLAENVGALSNRGLDRVVRALEQVGYIVHALRVGAWAVGAPHERQRWWIVALADAHRNREQPAGEWRGRRGRAFETWHDFARRGDRLGTLAVAHLGGWGIDQQGARAEGRAAAGWAGSPCGVALGNAAGAGLEGHRPDAGQPKEPEPWYAMPCRWPHPYLGGPTPQYEWEPPRLYQRGVGDGPDGLPARVADYLNKCGVAALGNAQVPEVVEVISSGMIAARRAMLEGAAA